MRCQCHQVHQKDWNHHPLQLRHRLGCHPSVQHGPFPRHHHLCALEIIADFCCPQLLFHILKGHRRLLPLRDSAKIHALRRVDRIGLPFPPAERAVRARMSRNRLKDDVLALPNVVGCAARCLTCFYATTRFSRQKSNFRRSINGQWR